MNFRKIIISGFLAAFLHVYSQQQETAIETVYVFDNQMNRVKIFQNISTISAEDLQKNSTNLSDVLRFQSPVFVKENGRGAVSSPSFRGTTAQHTAFVWNGISINSQFLGQGDINNIGFLTSDRLEVKSGGGSVIYGSGAIGGSIHLNNLLEFNKNFQGSYFSEIASFGTFNNGLKTTYSNEKLSVKFSGSYLISKNDFEVKEDNYLNRNGEYYNTNFNFAVAYKVAPHHKISWISEFFDGSQHYPVFFESQTKTKYETQNSRSLISWDFNKTKFQNSFKAAYTEENFSYFNQLHSPKFSGGNGKNSILKNDFNYFFNPKWNVNVITEFQNNKGEGYNSGIGEIQRNVGSAAVLMRYFANEKLSFEGGIKKDFVENISSPVLFSFNGKWKTASFYEVGINFSKNFRFPSFNDLYWQPGGNLDLKSETSYQGEMRNNLKINDFKISIIPYYIRIYDMIRWLPTGSFWSAFNTSDVESYGLETSLEFQKKFGKNSFHSKIGYSYTQSTDLETQKQLMYVPNHKVFGNINYQYSFLNTYVQGIFNGLTYTNSDESKTHSLDAYFVINAGISATILKNYQLGFKVNNVFDQIYQSTEFYFLPKRNYSFNLNINF